MQRFATYSLLTLALIVSAKQDSIGGTSEILEGSAITDRLVIGSSHIFANSDSLYIGAGLLERGKDYHFVSGQGYFDLSNLNISSNDTLKVIYSAVPSWLENWYGLPLPDLVPRKRSAPTMNRAVSIGSSLMGRQNISIKGAKGFRFSSQSNGSSSFGQSLDLAISGELTPGLELIGSISDRGISPTYGSANSRLNEFDRLNLTLRSNRLMAQLGDVVISKNHGTSSNKSISGVAMALEYPNWQANSVVARPRGRYFTMSLKGRDGFQGPYRIVEGATAHSIVPASETVWLNGKKLERGSNDDYIMDYPSGRVTFTSSYPIDARSRIEVDYELQGTDYKEELISFGGGAHDNDS